MAAISQFFRITPVKRQRQDYRQISETQQLEEDAPATPGLLLGQGGKRQLFQGLPLPGCIIAVLGAKIGRGQGRGIHVGSIRFKKINKAILLSHGHRRQPPAIATAAKAGAGFRRVKSAMGGANQV